MKAMTVGANGRYTPTCEDGICTLTGNIATSKLEGKIFTLLDYVLGGGTQGLEVTLRGRRRKLDMVFALSDTGALIVEYDGAFWHSSHERRDSDKTYAMVQGWDRFTDNLVVRIREHPLPPLGPLDVLVPPRPDVLLIVRLTLLHLLHINERALGDRVPHVIDFLRANPSPLTCHDVVCPDCWSVGESVLPHHLDWPPRRRRLPDAPPRPSAPAAPPVPPVPPLERINNTVPRARTHSQPPLPGL